MVNNLSKLKIGNNVNLTQSRDNNYLSNPSNISSHVDFYALTSSTSSSCGLMMKSEQNFKLDNFKNINSANENVLRKSVAESVMIKPEEEINLQKDLIHT
jgi:hypothetical protein